MDFIFTMAIFYSFHLGTNYTVQVPGQLKTSVIDSLNNVCIKKHCKPRQKDEKTEKNQFPRGSIWEVAVKNN